jgi:predicted nucleic acid-binding protein
LHVGHQGVQAIAALGGSDGVVVTVSEQMTSVVVQFGPQVLVIPPVVLVEARQRATDIGRVDVVLAKLRSEPILPQDGHRASELLRAAGARARNPSRRIHEIGVVVALVAAVAERLGGIVYTDDPQHMLWLVEAGAEIMPQRTPF